MNKKTIVALFLIFFASLAQNSFATYVSNLSDSDFLTHLEIKSLLTTIKPDPNAVEKLGILLNTTFSSFQDDRPIDLEDSIRVTQWNLESLNPENIFANFSEEQMSVLADTDIFTLNNVGFNNEKSKYQNMAKIFAEKFRANYVFAPEFLEASPEILEAGNLRQLVQIQGFKALSGNAIITKFPILKTKILRLPACYDWFYEEEQMILYEPDERKKVKNRVGEGELDLIRRGGRIALIADLLLPNGDVITVVSSQLENRAEPQCRVRQINATLSYLKTFTNPVVYGVDLNNIGKSAAPKTFSGVVEKTVKDPKFYIKQVISWLNPFSPITSLTSLTYGNYRKMKDPTVKHVPILLPNNAYTLFKAIHEFEFDDESQFDFSGTRDLANSNERKDSRYVKSYEYKGLIGKSKAKLDWIFVKAKTVGTESRYLPSDALTLSPEQVSENQHMLSMHYPISLQLVGF